MADTGGMTILVTGATGNVGRNVVDLLLEAGEQVRVTSRNPQSVDLPAAVDVHAADLTDPQSYVAPLSGVDKVFLYAQPSGVDGFVEVAKSAGVKHIVLLSSMSADPDQPHDNMISQMHLTVEAALEKSGIAWTFVRPGGFAT